MNFLRSILGKILFFALLGFFAILAFFNFGFVEFNFIGIKTLKMPLFIVIFISFVLGSMVNLLFFMISKKR